MSNFSLNLDEFQHIFSGDFESFGSMDVDELLDNILTAEEIQAYERTLDPNLSIALSTAVPTAAATANVNPQFPEGEIITSTVNGTDTQQSLLRQGSLTFPSPLSQKTVDEVWDELHKLQQEQENGSAANVQEVDSAQLETTSEEMTLKDFLIMAGVVRAYDRPPSPLLQQSCVLNQNNNNTALGSGPPGSMVRPAMGSGGGGDVPANQALLERSVKNAESVAVRTSSGYQPQEVRYDRKMQNNAGGGGCQQGSAASPVSSDSVKANQSKSVNNLHINGNAADKCIGPVEKVAARNQRRMIKNRESAARSRARRQAHTHDLEAELRVLKEENARLRQDLCISCFLHCKQKARKRIKQQYMEEFIISHKVKVGKEGLKRSWSCCAHHVAMLLFAVLRRLRKHVLVFQIGARLDVFS
ncbi:BZIP domain-containing protein [Heracleum sosnowskyi]|uniref:BZIP domain-containing protein n=1 Tax=Heracleum sosnowskyi TaxID=360622 RepID=A0AAD8IIP1_9APIA|nr:BZIP domain-containing protein [Heracleum sosnowskyi]